MGEPCCLVWDLLVVEHHAGFPDVGGPAGAAAATGEVVECYFV